MQRNFIDNDDFSDSSKKYLTIASGLLVAVLNSSPDSFALFTAFKSLELTARSRIVWDTVVLNVDRARLWGISNLCIALARIGNLTF
jgi:hypothetical protein